MVNKFLSSLGKSVIKNKQLPSRLNLLKTAVTHPVGVGKTLFLIDKKAVTAGKVITGKGRLGQTTQKAKRFAQTDTAKDLAVNTGGALGSAIGGSIGGSAGALVGDNLGALASRKGINRTYARIRAKRKLGDNASPLSIRKQAQNTNIALERLEKRKGSYLSDQVGWGVGNAVATSTSWIPIPLRGGAVAIRTVPQITRNVKKVIKGQIKPNEFVGQTVRDIAKNNNLGRIIKRGNARERLLRKRINKVIRLGDFRSNRSLIYFSQVPYNPTRALPLYSRNKNKSKQKPLWVKQAPNRVAFY